MSQEKQQQVSLFLFNALVDIAWTPCSITFNKYKPPVPCIVSGRHSNDASAANKCSPKRSIGLPRPPVTETKTVALEDSDVTFAASFPKVKQGGSIPIQCRLDSDTQEFLLKEMMPAAFRCIRRSLLYTEEARVHVVSEVRQ